MPMIHAFGESSIQETITVDNKTFNIIIESPTNEISINTDTTEIERLLANIENMQKNDLDYDYGDVLLSSATILSFLGFGSFLFIRRNNLFIHKNLPKLISIVLLCVLAIVLSHLFVMTQIILDMFSSDQYVIVLILTSIFMIVITITMIKINYALFELKKLFETASSIYPELKNVLDSNKNKDNTD